MFSRDALNRYPQAAIVDFGSAVSRHPQWQNLFGEEQSMSVPHGAKVLEEGFFSAALDESDPEIAAAIGKELGRPWPALRTTNALTTDD